MSENVSQVKMEWEMFARIVDNTNFGDDGLHAQGEYSTDEGAIAELMNKAQALLFSYDEVICRIVQGERVVHRKTIYSP
jgi:hypothetical protein